MVILGLNAYHADSAACLIVDGRLVAAAEEERFRRIKHWAGLPTKAIDYCLTEARLNLSEVGHIAINRKPGINNWRRLGFVVTHWPSPQLMMQKIKNIRSAVSAKETLEKTYRMELKAEVHQVEHHLAHLASAFLVSDFEEAACLSVDGFGDFASTAFGFGLGHKITIDQRIYFPHSLGIFYSALTQYLGFPHYGDEYKVMGLAPYGEPKMIEPLREVVSIQTDGTFRLNLDYFRHHSDNVSYTWEDCTPSVGLLYKSALVDLLGPARAPNEPLEQKHKDLARSIQVTYEKAFFSLLHTLHKQHPCNNLALAGGCAMNSVANGKIYRRTPFTQMYIPAAAGDAGGAIGAAAVVLAELDDSAVFAPAERRRPAEMRPSGATVSPVRAAITDEEPVVVQEEEDDPFAPWETREKLKAERLKAEKGNEEQANGGTGEAGLELVERVVSGSEQGGGDALNPKENRGRRLAGFQSRRNAGEGAAGLSKHSTQKAFGGAMRSTEGELKTETLRAETLKVETLKEGEATARQAAATTEEGSEPLTLNDLIRPAADGKEEEEEGSNLSAGALAKVELSAPNEEIRKEESEDGGMREARPEHVERARPEPVERVASQESNDAAPVAEETLKEDHAAACPEHVERVLSDSAIDALQAKISPDSAIPARNATHSVAGGPNPPSEVAELPAPISQEALKEDQTAISSDSAIDAPQSEIAPDSAISNPQSEIAEFPAPGSAAAAAPVAEEALKEGQSAISSDAAIDAPQSEISPDSAIPTPQSALPNPQSAISHLPSPISDLPSSSPPDEVPIPARNATHSVAGGRIPISEIPQPYLPSPIGELLAVPIPIPSVALRPLHTAYLGPESTQQEIHALLDWKKQEIGYAGCIATFLSEEELNIRTAQAIADGKVIGWFQGRMEWGPRALGNRSILADPRRADMKDILNAKIKRRESFRPFAPSILREAVADWFEQEDDVPFMMEVFQIRPQKRSFIPAVTHVDGSGRLQTVHKETNPQYYRLIEKFRDLTGIPMVLNTSFNENEPVVCYPEEALDCFLRTKMDVLVLGNFCIERKA